MIWCPWLRICCWTCWQAKDRQHSSQVACGRKCTPSTLLHQVALRELQQDKISSEQRIPKPMQKEWQTLERRNFSNKFGKTWVAYTIHDLENERIGQWQKIQSEATYDSPWDLFLCESDERRLGHCWKRLNKTKNERKRKCRAKSKSTCACKWVSLRSKERTPPGGK